MESGLEFIFKAIEHQDKFLDPWEDADPEIAEVDLIEDARKRQAELKSK